MAITSSGIGSGLDISGLITQLMTVEAQPLTVLARKEADYQAKLTAFGSVKGAVSTFQTAVQALSSTSKFSASKATAGDATVLSASTTSIAVPGTYGIEVSTLAQAQKMKSKTFETASTTVGSGTLTIQFGTYAGGDFTLNPDKGSKTISIPADASSLTGVRDAINSANAGVTASIVNDGSGFRLVLGSKDSGAANALKISVADDDGNATDNAGLSALAYDASTGGTVNMTETLAGRNAEFTVDGVTVSKASNTVTDVISGVTLNLLKTNAGTPTTLTVAKDKAGTKTAVDAFVKAYNDLNTTLKDLTKYDATNKISAALTGDATVRSIQSQMRSMLTTTLPTAGGGVSRLSDVGITFQKDGSLKVDAAKLDAVMSDPAKDISTLFASVGKPTDSMVKFVSSTKSTQPGHFGVEITQMAAQGKASGGSPANLTIDNNVNDKMILTVDGTAISITLSAGTYTADTLAAELQSKINGSTSLGTGSSVRVTHDAGLLSITSNKYGATSGIEINAGNAVSGLFGAVTSTPGQDIAGTIGGTVATGSGQTLTANGSAAGMVLLIEGGSIGSRGVVNYSTGLAVQLDALASGLLEEESGSISARIDGINSGIKQIADRRVSVTRHLEDVEARFRKQFAALDTMLASMNQTSGYLTQQLEAISNLNSNS